MAVVLAADRRRVAGMAALRRLARPTIWRAVYDVDTPALARSPRGQGPSPDVGGGRHAPALVVQTPGPRAPISFAVASPSRDHLAAMIPARSGIRCWRAATAALRDQALVAVSDSRDGSRVPFDTAVQEEPESTVAEVAEAVADAFDFLDEQVHGFGWPVGQAGACQPRMWGSQRRTVAASRRNSGTFAVRQCA